MYSSGESVHNSEFSCVASQGRQTRDEIQGSVGPGLVGHRQWSRQACRGTMGCFAAGTDEAGRDKLLGVNVYWRPPKMLRHLPQERTRALENSFFSQVISSASGVQRNRSLVEVSWLRGEATWLLSFMKRWKKLANPKKRFSCLRLSGVDQSVTPYASEGSVLTCPLDDKSQENSQTTTTTTYPSCIRYCILSLLLVDRGADYSYIDSCLVADEHRGGWHDRFYHSRGKALFEPGLGFSWGEAHLAKRHGLLV